MAHGNAAHKTRPHWLQAAFYLCLAMTAATALADEIDDAGLALLRPPQQTVGARLMQSALAHNWGVPQPEQDALVPLNRDWSMLARTSLSGAQTDLLPGSNPYGGGETVHNVWLAPNTTSNDGLLLAGGTAYLSTDPSTRLAGTDRWGVGPSGVVMMQSSQWQWGVQASHIWSYATPGVASNLRNAGSVSAMQPFLAFTQKSGLTWSVGSESSYDWAQHNWAVPVSAGVSKAFNFGQQKASLGLEGKYWMARPDTAPGWGVRLTASVLFPD